MDVSSQCRFYIPILLFRYERFETKIKVLRQFWKLSSLTTSTPLTGRKKSKFRKKKNRQNFSFTYPQLFRGWWKWSKTMLQIWNGLVHSGAPLWGIGTFNYYKRYMNKFTFFVMYMNKKYLLNCILIILTIYFICKCVIVWILRYLI